ncbi:hypothetical protein LSS_21780 [Leptospira santarosai serovar Shermani str. LT 821]|uniref:Uncharacterized protein n=1 Tax=Leptospira santarosai serovar Shermani str. LT 821 TaxID=758847 RepID=A0A097ESK5_9LEPT|nr:hypothetical protein LSS_21780 [Leptospira santarosai serovar Shermani str. LT 821]
MKSNDSFGRRFLNSGKTTFRFSKVSIESRQSGTFSFFYTIR